MLSVTDHGEPVRDGIKVQRLQQLLCSMMDHQGNGVVNIKTVCIASPKYSSSQVFCNGVLAPPLLVRDYLRCCHVSGLHPFTWDPVLWEALPLQ